MKKQNRVGATLTSIEDISTIGNELSDERLRLVSGGKRKRTRIVTYSPAFRESRVYDVSLD